MGQSARHIGKYWNSYNICIYISIHIHACMHKHMHIHRCVCVIYTALACACQKFSNPGLCLAGVWSVFCVIVQQQMWFFMIKVPGQFLLLKYRIHGLRLRHSECIHSLSTICAVELSRLRLEHATILVSLFLFCIFYKVCLYYTYSKNRVGSIPLPYLV